MARTPKDMGLPTPTLVTPDRARRFLERNTRNRNLRPVHVRRLADMMTKGQWRRENPHGSILMFDEEGTLMDGQHRLEAVILSGVGQWFYVFESVPRDIMPILDTEQAARSLKDSLKILLGVDAPENVEKMVPIVAMLLRWEPGEYGVKDGFIDVNATVADQSDFFLANMERLSEAATAARRSSGKPLRLVVSASGAVYFVLRERDVPQEIVDEFFDQIATGAMLPLNNPVMKLRHLLASRVHEEASRTTYVKNVEMLRVLVECWNNWSLGKSGHNPKFLRTETIPGINTDCRYVRKWIR